MTDQDRLAAWLESEAGADEDAADAAFANVYAPVGRVDASPEFIARTATLAWLARVRRRRLARIAWGTAALAVIGGVAVATGMALPAAVWVVKSMASAISNAAPWLVAYATEAISVWWFVARIAEPLATALGSPAAASVLVGVELIGILTFYALYRVIQFENEGEVPV